MKKNSWVFNRAVVFALLVCIVTAAVALSDARTNARLGGEVSTVANPIERATFKVEGMTCGGCEATIKRALEKIEGVRAAEASYEKGEAVVEFDPEKTKPEELNAAIERIGYGSEMIK